MAVSNTTVLLYLLKIQRLDLLENIFHKIYITPAVFDELTAQNQYEPEKVLLERYIESGYICLFSPKKVHLLPLGLGESSAISLCLERHEKIFLSDDKRAREVARAKEITSLGTVGILIKNVQQKKISAKEGMLLLNMLIEQGFYVSIDLYREVAQEMVLRE